MSGKNTVMICITFSPESVKDLVSHQKSLLAAAGIKDGDNPPPEWFSGADFRSIHKDLRGNCLPSSDSYLTVKQEYWFTYFSCSQSDSIPVIMINIYYQSGALCVPDATQKAIVERIDDHWLNKCHIQNISKQASTQ